MPIPMHIYKWYGDVQKFVCFTAQHTQKKTIVKHFSEHHHTYIGAVVGSAKNIQTNGFGMV